MTAPDQCCINVKKLLSIKRRPHMTHCGHKPGRDPAAQQSPAVLRCAILSVAAIITPDRREWHPVEQSPPFNGGGNSAAA
jgi:hypothetical protein